MHHYHTSLATLAITVGLTLAGCGGDNTSTPGYGHPNPNGTGGIVADNGKSAASTPRNARLPDIHSLKEFEALLAKLPESSTVAINKILGPPMVAQTGPYAGMAIYPNLYFDGWFVQSISLVPTGGDRMDMRKRDMATLDIMVIPKEIPFIRPEQMSWFKPPSEKTP